MCFSQVNGSGSVHITVRERHPSNTLLATVYQVRSPLVIVRQRKSVVVHSGQAVGVCFKVGPLVVWEGHGEESLGITHKFVHIPLASNLKREEALEERKEEEEKKKSWKTGATIYCHYE